MGGFRKELFRVKREGLSLGINELTHGETRLKPRRSHASSPLEHIVLKCPRYNRIREEWFQEWNTWSGADIPREPISRGLSQRLDSFPLLQDSQSAHSRAEVNWCNQLQPYREARSPGRRPDNHAQTT